MLLLVLVVAGLVLLRDRPGLRAEYFALRGPWKGQPFNRGVGLPRLDGASQVGEALKTKVLFSIRWRGWWWVGQTGEHRFTLDADDGGYLRIDGETVVDKSTPSHEARLAGSKELARGFHRVEAGLYQRYGESRLAIDWVPPGRDPPQRAALPLAELYSGRPLLLRRGLRRALGGWPRPFRQLLGVVLLLSAALIARRFAPAFAGPAAKLRERLGAGAGPRAAHRLRAGLLLALFVATFVAVLPYTGTVLGGDDTSYLGTATFDSKQWYFIRYGHVYLLKLFTGLSGGDPLVGVRVWWSFVFATTVAALAVAVKSVGPGLQLRTLVATLFVLFAQSSLIGLIGAGFADYSAMMFVTAAVATCMHGIARDRERAPPRHEWHALAIGALTVAAFRSKEVGLILLLLPPLFVFAGGAIDLRRFARRMAYWTMGAAALVLVLMLVDGWVLGDFLFTLNSERLAGAREMNFPAGQKLREIGQNWFHAIWRSHQHPGNLSLRNLWLGVWAAALVAGTCRRRIELRLLHLLPIAYLVALIALYVRLPHPVSTRMLITILPVASLMTGLLLNYAGLEELSWRRLTAPAVLIPSTLAAAVLFLVVVPYRLGSLDANSLLPGDLLLRHGWTPDHFLVGVVLPLALLAGAGALALVAGSKPARVAALGLAYIALFGPGFEFNRASLVKRWALQTGELLVYPWRTFATEIAGTPNARVAISRDLDEYFNMSARTRTALAHVTLGRSDLFVYKALSPTAYMADSPNPADLAIASRYTYDTWVQHEPALAATATFGPEGFLVLVRPKQAAEHAGTPTGQPEASLQERLEELKEDRAPETRERLLQWILDRLEGSERLRRSLGAQSLDGERVQAVALETDGWTLGVAPAGLVLRRSDEDPWAQPLRLTVHAPAPRYPIRVFVDEGEERRVVEFDRGGSREILLRPVPRRSSRLVLVWSDTAWPAKNPQDDRQLGVRIRVLPAAGA